MRFREYGCIYGFTDEIHEYSTKLSMESWNISNYNQSLTRAIIAIELRFLYDLCLYLGLSCTTGFFPYP